MIKIADDIEEDIISNPDYHPSSDMWSAYLCFPRPSMLSDEQMEVHFHDHDGQWSHETKAAIVRHNAKGLDLNENWALTWRGWSCPSCGRTKEAIFRLSKRGILLAKLELHHDHLADFIWSRAEQILGKDWRDAAAPGFGEVLDTIRKLVTRFSESLLCSECNAADGKVKGCFRNEIDSRFTFTAPEIGCFVKPRPHREHIVDYDEAIRVWKSQEHGFTTRLNILDTLLARLGEGSLARERQGATGAGPVWTALGSNKLLQQAFYEEAKDSERSVLLSRLRAEFLARSTSRDSVALPRSSKTKCVSGPTDAEFDAYIDPVSKRLWIETSPTWVCPVCLRSKREIIRKSNKGKWSGGLRRHEEFVDEFDIDVINKRRWLFPDFRNKYWIARTETEHICSDCRAISLGVAQSNPSLEKPYLKLQDLRDCLIESGSHRDHIVDADQARQRAINNEGYWSAWSALSAFQNKIATFHGHMEYWEKRGVERSKIIANLCEDLHVHNQIIDPFDQKALVEWLLELDERSDSGKRKQNETDVE